MSDVRVPVADARTILHDLNEGQWNTRHNNREINVSFRDHGGAVGRRDFATHWIHWYPAKMFHRIPSVFLDTVELPAQAKILDPFCGSGTVLLEANLRGHHAIGIDINPLARLISRVKITPLDPSDPEESACATPTKSKAIPLHANSPTDTRLLAISLGTRWTPPPRHCHRGDRRR